MSLTEENLSAHGFVLRNGRKDDLPFINKSWLNSLWHNLEEPYQLTMKKDFFFAGHHHLIEQLEPRMKIKVITQDNDLDHILGFLAYEELTGAQIFHFVFVKHIYAGFGLSKVLIEHVLDRDHERFFTQRTMFAKKMATRYGLLFNPYLLYTPEREETLCRVIEKRTQRNQAKPTESLVA